MSTPNQRIRRMRTNKYWTWWTTTLLGQEDVVDVGLLDAIV